MTTRELIAVLTDLDPAGILPVRILGMGDFDGHQDIYGVTDKASIYSHDSEGDPITEHRSLGYLLIEYD